MAQISIGGAIGSGFGVIRQRPLSMLVWGFIPMLLGAAAVAVFAPTYFAMFAAMAQQAQSGAQPTAASMAPYMSQMMVTQGLVWLIDFAQIFVTSVIYCAIWRAVLHPEKRGFAYIQIGAPELLLFVLTIAAAILFFILMFILMIPLTILIGVSIGASHSASGAAMAVLLIPLVLLVALIVMLVIGLRFAFVGPMMVDDGKFHLFESWSATKGHVGALLGIAIVLLLIAIVFGLLTFAIMGGLGAAGFLGVIGGPAGLATFARLTPLEMLTRLAPLIAVYFVLLIPLNGCLLAIFGAPWARAYRDLMPDASATFA